MSENDSFLQEVTEEVRRDQMVRTLRRYAPWIGGGLILVICAIAFSEYRAHSVRTAAETRGDAISAALTADDPATAIAGIEALLEDGGSAEPVLRMQLAGLQAQSGDREAAAETLEAVAGGAGVSPIYADVARLKLAMVGAGGVRSVEARLAVLALLTGPEHPLRGLAEEQVGLIRLEEGDRDGALDAFGSSLSDATLNAESRARIEGLITALGGVVPDAPGLIMPDLDG
ncbi:MAG: tetratricopeptide repeat protein [Pseudomonadota bacterium]